MLVVLPIIILMSVFFLFSLPIIETLCVSYISIPILNFFFNKLFLKFNISSGVFYTISTLIVIFICLYVKKFKINKTNFSELNYCVVFIFTYLCLYILNLSWADFISMGERLRDYSILASVINSPVNLIEPWYQGLTLNYYAFWFRAGSMLSFIFNYEVWDTYHVLSALNTTFFVTLILIIVNKYLKFSFLQSMFLTLMVFPGSNVSGIKFYFSKDTNWWGPSRVIKGAITEFPTWSFVLGDIHPHFLNLLFFPFIISLLLLFPYVKQNFENKITLFLLFLLIPSLVLFNANVWDLPLYLTILFGYIGFLGIIILAYKKNVKLKTEENKWSFRTYLWWFLIGVFAISLYCSSRNIMSVGAKLEFVSGEVKRTLFYEFIEAFGIQFFLIFLGIMLLIRNNIAKSIFSVLLVFSLFFSKLFVFPILIMLIFNIYRIHENIKSQDEYIKNSTALIFETIGMSCLLFWILPEFIYLQDGYGIENARMNTIFKIYSANWAISYLFAFYLLKNILAQSKFLSEKFIYVLIPVSILSVLCFFKLIELRKYDYDLPMNERREGLTKLNEMYNGAKATIAKLRTLPKGVVLESTEGAYNYASHVATLSGNVSYMGWMNHVQLLYKNYNEVQARKKIIDEFYTAMSCNERKEFLNQNNIKYVVYGPLEKAEYKDRINNDFYCLKNIIQYGEYIIFSKE